MSIISPRARLGLAYTYLGGREVAPGIINVVQWDTETPWGTFVTVVNASLANPEWHPFNVKIEWWMIYVYVPSLDEINKVDHE